MDTKLDPSRIPRNVCARSRRAAYVCLLLPLDTGFGRGRRSNRENKIEESKDEPVARRTKDGMNAFLTGYSCL